MNIYDSPIIQMQKTSAPQKQTPPTNKPGHKGPIRFKNATNVIQRIQPIQQTMANCGMFAMAMALADLLDLDGEVLADGLELYAMENGLSALGEAFNADELAMAGQGYCDSNQIGEHLEFRVLTFTTQEEMTAIFNKTLPGQIYVLFPYFATGRNVTPGIPPGPYQPDGQPPIAAPHTMTQAHWAVVENLEAQGERILEGHNHIYGGPTASTLNPARYQDLFQSNKSLGGALEWNQYLNATLENMPLHSRAQQDMDYFFHSDRSGMEIVRDEQGHFRQAVNLRGRAIMVGKRDNVQTALQNLHLVSPNIH